MTQTYTPTLMEKLLGKYYKWWYMIGFSVKAHRAYRIDTLLWAVGNFLMVIGPIFVWWISYQNGANVDPNQIITYLLIGNLFKNIINSWADFDMGWMGRSGHIVTQLIVPTNIFPRWICHYIGAATIANLPVMGLSTIILMPFLWQFLLPPSLTQVLLFLAMIPIGFLIKFFFDFTMGCLVFWIMETGGLQSIKNSLYDLAQGALTPLFILNNYLPGIIYQPLAWTFHHPMQIYLGKYDLNQTLMVFAGGIAWCVVLWLLANWVFRLGLKRNESVGL